MRHKVCKCTANLYFFTTCVCPCVLPVPTALRNRTPVTFPMCQIWGTLFYYKEPKGQHLKGTYELIENSISFPIEMFLIFAPPNSWKVVVKL